MQGVAPATTAALILVGLLLVVAPAIQAQGPLEIQFSPAAPRVGQSIQFSATPTDNVTDWAWAFGDNTTSIAPEPQHAYADAGDYTVQLLATFAGGNHTTTNATIHVAAIPPPGLAPSWNFPTWFYWTMPLVVGFILLGIALMVLVRGQPVIYNRVFFFLYAASALKSFTEFLFYVSHYEFDGRSIHTFLGINRAISFLYPHFFLWFVLVFPRPLRPWLKNGWRGSIVLLLSLPFFLLEYVFLASEFTLGVFNVYVSIVALVSLGLLIYHAWETDGREERHRIRLLSVSFFLLVFSTIVVTLFTFLAQTADGATASDYEALRLASGLIFAPLLEIVGCVLLMYAILRYQLLGVELFLRRVTRATAFAISVGTVFVVVSNSVEQLFEAKWLSDIKGGFIIAGFISTGMMYPIQKGTERLANQMFPNAASQAPDHLSTRRMEIYEAQLRYALLDGSLKQKELSMLHALRESLGLRAEELRSVSQRFPGVNVALLMGATRPSLRAP